MIETRYRIDGCPVPIALLADTHDTDPAPILASLRSHAPTLITLAGDFVRGRKPRPGDSIGESRNALALLAGCAALAPTFLSVGNHDAYLTQADFDAVRATGAKLLDNAFLPFDAGGRRLVVGGLSSGYHTAYRRCGATERDVRSPDPETAWLADFAAAEGYHILLMHHPEYIRLVPPSVELVLSGHAHGGQWRFYDLRTKAWRGVYAPDQGLFPPLTGGVVDGRLVISQGLSNPAGLPRLHNDTEIVYIDGG